MIYDISMWIEEGMQVYKNRESKQPKLTQTATFEEHTVYETDITMNLHTGTHIDYPLHAIKDSDTSTTHSLEPLLGKATVYNMVDIKDGISKADIIGFDIKQDDFVLFRTKNSFEDTFNFEFIYIKEDAAKYLKEKQVRGVGIDALGVERNQKGHPTHNHLLSNGIIIIEGLRLKEVIEGQYTMYCLPLKIKNVEALPARVILIDEKK